MGPSMAGDPRERAKLCECSQGSQETGAHWLRDPEVRSSLVRVRITRLVP